MNMDYVKMKGMASKDSSGKIKKEKMNSLTKASKGETDKGKTGKQNNMRSSVKDSTIRKDNIKPVGKADNDK